MKRVHVQIFFGSMVSKIWGVTLLPHSLEGVCLTSIIGADGLLFCSGGGGRRTGGVKCGLLKVNSYSSGLKEPHTKASTQRLVTWHRHSESTQAEHGDCALLLRKMAGWHIWSRTAFSSGFQGLPQGCFPPLSAQWVESQWALSKNRVQSKVWIFFKKSPHP